MWLVLFIIGGRSGPDTVGLFTFLTLGDFQSCAK
jgi:hypothetical protein